MASETADRSNGMEDEGAIEIGQQRLVSAGTA